jgi:hypothetical protein
MWVRGPQTGSVHLTNTFPVNAHLDKCLLREILSCCGITAKQSERSDEAGVFTSARLRDVFGHWHGRLPFNRLSAYKTHTWAGPDPVRCTTAGSGIRDARYSALRQERLRFQAVLSRLVHEDGQVFDRAYGTTALDEAVAISEQWASLCLRTL